ncbi:unnamed protein product [Larinioides sclopetarius]|uniref:Uncharacterized protein n=1 Tax=Larinioides sclopetarius TaxID=280406 RepID=A0AAV2BP11_9ARAC
MKNHFLVIHVVESFLRRVV